MHDQAPEASAALPLTRRERRRQATYDEIVEVSRRLLRTDGELSLRTIATDMGMTPPALYRYVNSMDELHTLVAEDIYHDVVDFMRVARDRYAEDPAGQLAAAATAFRNWALSNKTEFKEVFATPLATRSPRAASIVDFSGQGESESGSKLFADFFAEIFIQLAARRLIVVPPSQELDDSLLGLIENPTRPAERRIFEALGREGVGTFWLFQLAWARLYGVLMLEVFELIDTVLIKSGAVFAVLMRENFDSLGLADSWDRLRAISRDVEAIPVG